MADDSKTIQQQVDDQNAQIYQDDSSDGGEAVDIDKLHEDTFGEEHHTNQSLNTADEINSDEADVVQGTPPPGSSASDEEETEE